MFLRCLTLTTSALLFTTVMSFANTIRVPIDYPKIQLGINAAVNGDTVLVAPGTYLENINFKGKKIVVASHYILSKDPSVIKTTIIDGSNPTHSDTASCVLMVSGEDSTSVLEGFTITKGNGTKWLDEHGAGTYYEGGGILVTLSSPTIKNNLIINNSAARVSSGVTSAGGGGIRCGDASARIFNNVIMNNTGMYGGGIVLNYCSGAIVKNNIIAQNRVYDAVSGVSTFGGGGIWILEKKPGDSSPNIIENNTIVGNVCEDADEPGAAGDGGGLLVWNANVVSQNNLIWGNLQAGSGPIAYLGGGNFSVNYSDVEGGYAGTGNINLNPMFADSSLYLKNDSPCIDAGNPSVQFNDPENPASPGNALFPSMGTPRNDIGAYGGAFRNFFPNFSQGKIYLKSTDLNFGNIIPGGSKTLYIQIRNLGAGKLSIDSSRFLRNLDNEFTQIVSFPLNLNPLSVDSFQVKWTPVSSYVISDSLQVYHNDNNSVNPLVIKLVGNSNPLPDIFVNTLQHNFGNIDINTPSHDTTFYVYNDGTGYDSLFISVDPKGVNPPTALNVSPLSIRLAPNDSIGVTFTFYPRQIIKTGLGIYSPSVVIDSRFNPGTTRFEKSMRFRLTGTVSVENDSKFPREFRLEQNYPNPFNPETVIRYQLIVNGHVSLKIYDLIGKEVAVLVDEFKDAGVYHFPFSIRQLTDPFPLSSGIYFYKLEVGEFIQTRKMFLLK